MIGKLAYFTMSLMVLLILAHQVDAGSISGTVLDTQQVPVAGAAVRISGDGPNAVHALTSTDVNGHYLFDDVPAATYTVTAMKARWGFAATTLIVEQPDITADLALGVHGGRCGQITNDLLPVSLAGVAMLRAPDSTHALPRYFLDVDRDGHEDYQLSFGPPWYLPSSGATRPTNGQTITVTAGLFGYGTAPLVIVYSLNGEIWRTGGHGGYGGDVPFLFRRCSGSSDALEINEAPLPERIETFGDIMLPACYPPIPNPPGVFYYSDICSDSGYGITHYVNMGLDYRIFEDPIEDLPIVGGYIPPTDTVSLPWIIVYEINGEVIREPGDTTRISTMYSSAIEDPIHRVGEPLSYITARNYPNPFNPTTVITYSIPQAGKVSLTVYNITGGEVANLVNTRQIAGEYQVAWNAANMPSGLYFYRVSVGNLSFVNRMVLMK